MGSRPHLRRPCTRCKPAKPHPDAFIHQGLRRITFDKAFAKKERQRSVRAEAAPAKMPQSFSEIKDFENDLKSRIPVMLLFGRDRLERQEMEPSCRH
jgi:hypothetical protein